MIDDMNIVVFSSSKDASEQDMNLARDLGAAIAQRGWCAVNGGGPGLMNAVLAGAKRAGGETFAVQLARHQRQQSPFADRSIASESLRERQGMLIQRGQAFVALPGGLGTHYEILEILSLKNAGELAPDIPLILLGECYQSFEKHLDLLRKMGYATAASEHFFHRVSDVNECMARIAEGLARH